MVSGSRSHAVRPGTLYRIVGSGTASIDRLEVAVKVILAGAVVVRRDQQQAVGARRVFAACDSSIVSRVEFEPVPAMTGTRLFAACTTSSMTRTCSSLVTRRRFARRPDGDQPVDARRDLLVDQAAQRLFVDRVAAEGRDERGDGPLKHRLRISHRSGAGGRARGENRRMTYRYRLLGLLGSAVLGLAACGGSATTADGGGGGAAGGSGGGSTGSAGTGGGIPGFITGTVDGVVVRAESEPKAGIQGVADGQIWVVAGTAPTSWNLYVQNQVGMHDCAAGWVALFDNNGNPRSDQAAGSCSVNVTSAAPAIGDVIQGTFTATLKSTTPARTVTVTDGAFRVVRTNP